MSQWYSKAREALLGGDIDVDTASIKIYLLDGYTFDDTDEFLSDIIAGVRVDQTAALASVTKTGGTLDAADPAAIASVAAGNTIDGAVAYIDTGVESTSRLLVFIDEDDAAAPLSLATNGGNITVSFDAAGIADA